MKKKIVIISLIIFIIGVSVLGIYMYLNYRDSKICLINGSVSIEYGESYNPTINDLIDINKYNFIDPNKVSIKNEIINEQEKNYPKVGEYSIHIYYKKLELVQKVEVKDTTSPEVIIDEKIELPYNTSLENYDFKKHIKVNDLSETKECNIDYSNVNKEVAGEYIVKIEVEDVYNNKTQKEFKIVIQEKIEESIVNETPLNNETKTTSNKTKAQNNKNTKKANKTPTTNNNTQVSSSTQQQTNNNNNQTQQTSTPYWCVEGGSHHIAGDGANEHGYYNSWNAANQAFKEYTKNWDSCQYKVDVCACGKYYFWAVK